MARKINPNLRHLVKSYRSGQRGVALEGSSRSGKTWSGIDFLVYLCSKVETNAVILIIRETYNSFKTTLYEDFNKRFPYYGLKSPFEDVQERASFKLFGNKVHLIGADKPSKYLGAGSDYVFFNEAIHVSKKIFDQAEMRCSKFWWMDYNPEESKHWIYDNVLSRPDVSYLQTTFLDNPFCPPAQRKKILSYDPSNPDNVAAGTADEYMWDVYGLGKRADKKGKIYKHWNKYKDLPDGAKFIGYGIDFGFSNDPAAVVGMWEHPTGLYFREYIYQTELTDDHLADRMTSIGINPMDDFVADSSEPKAITVLRRKGFRVFKAYKGPDSIEHGIKLLQGRPMFIHEKSVNMINEADSYCWKMDLNDQPMNVPIDRDNHLLDAARYIATHHLDRRPMKFD